jgi:hypothetical protein
MERKYDHNARIVYVDPQGIRHEALVTAWWGTRVAEAPDTVPNRYSVGDVYESPAYGQTGMPGCNLLFIAKDSAKFDNYGRQLERATSVVHKSRQTAPANYWCWPDELT